MATKIVTKSGSGAPATTDLVAGELAVDLTNKRLYTENGSAAIIEVGSNPYNFTANHDGSAKLATTSTGIDVTGIVTADGAVNSTYFIGGSSSVAGRQLTLSCEANGVQDNAIHRLTVPSGYGTFNVNVGGSERLVVNTTGIDVTGSVTADGYAHTGDTDTYFHFPSANQLSLVGGGVEIARAYRIAGAYGVLKMNGSGSATYPNFTFNDDDNTGMYRAGTDILAFSTAGAERLRIDSSGNVGIGTTSPQKLLDITENSSGESIPVVIANRDVTAGTGQKVTLGFGLSRNSGAFKPEAGTIEVGRDSDWTASDANIDSYMAFSTYLNNSATEKMRIDSSGNLGLGTSSPQTSLSIETSGVQNVVSPIVTGQTAGVTYGGLYTVRDGAGDQRGLALQVYTANVGLNEAMRIDSAGHAIIPAGVTLGTAAGVYDAAKTLEDYEEGIFTPTLSATSSGTITEATQVGTYTKIGRVVTCNISITVASVSSPIGYLSINALPFASASTVISTCSFYGHLFTDNTGFIEGSLNVSSTSISVSEFVSGDRTSNFAANVQAGTVLQATITYQTA